MNSCQSVPSCENVKKSATVFVVDDDLQVRKSLQLLMWSIPLNVKVYASAQEFLADYDPQQMGCLVLDIRMPGMSGLELQKKLTARHIDIPIIMITAHGEVATAVQALKAGALDFVQKPYSPQILLDRVQQAIKQDIHRREAEREHACIAVRLASLTPREKQVLKLLVGGQTTKEIAVNLQVSPKTVDFHRWHVLEKMEANSLVELGRLVDSLTNLQRSQFLQ